MSPAGGGRYAHVTVSSSWTPASLSGLLAWYDASNAASITASGGAVSQWNDLSGNSRHLTQASGTSQPLTGSVTIGGVNTITFDGSNDDMSYSGTTFSTGDVAIACVFQKIASDNTMDRVDGGGGNGQLGSGTSFKGGFGAYARTDTFDLAIAGDATLDNNAHYRVMWYTASTAVVSWRLGGVAQTDSAAAASGHNVTLDRIILGNNSPGGGQPWHGSLGEWFIWNPTTIATEYAAFESYAAAKWTL